MAEQPDARAMLETVVRAGKSAVQRLGAEPIERFIRAQPGIVGAVTISDLRGAGDVGASSGIVLFTATYDSGAGPVTRELVLRHAPGSETRLFFEYDLERQFRVQRALQGRGVPVPEPLWLDADGRWLGVPGFVMVAARGTAPNASAFARGPLAEASAEDRARMLDQVMQALVRVHQTDVVAAGLDDFMMNAPGETAMQRYVNWYWRSWEWFQLPEYARLLPVQRWLVANAPSGKPELLHGDASLHNYLFDGARLVGMLDWEMSTLGRAEADLALQCVGNALFAAPRDSGVPQPPGEAQWLEMYQRAGGRALHDFDYFKKLANYLVIVCIYGLQRHLPAEARQAQDPLLNRCWAHLEA